jgi:non-haem Fe2+, alpha-ketoglutarate-dependent halogenase
MANAGEIGALVDEHGYAAPIRVMSAAEAGEVRAWLEELDARRGEAMKPIFRSKPHLVFPRLYDLLRSDAVLDAVEAVLGPDLLAWSSSFFWKRAHDPGFVSWHQDSTYWGLEPLDIVTAWIAFSPSTPANGCMRVVPGSHRIDQLPHRDTFAPENLLSRGQEIAVEVDPATAVDLALQPGEMSLHHVKIVHGSEPNPTDVPRIGFTVRYIPTYVRQTGVRTTATLCRGVDRYGHFDHEPRPKADLDPEAIAFRRDALERAEAVLFAGTERPRARAEA